MIYNKDFMFLHYPKTAGKSLTRFFLDVWERPIDGLISQGQFSEIEGIDLDGVNLQTGRGHENFEQSAKILADRGRDVTKLRAVFICIRNPYDLMVSNYFFMRKTYQRNKGNANFELAAMLPFEDYCIRMTMAPPERWMLYKGELPANLRIIRFEQLTADLTRYADEFGFSMKAVPHINATDHDHYLTYITERAEPAIYKHFQWMIDSGYYPRHNLEAQKATA